MQFQTAEITTYQQYKQELLNIYSEAFSEGISAQYVSEKQTLQYFDKIFKSGYGIFAIDGGKLLGAILIVPLSFDKELPPYIAQNFPVENSLYVAEMMVEKNNRGKGIGKKMMQYFMENIERKKYEFVFIRVLKENIAATMLYKKTGFEQCAEIAQLKTKPNGKNKFLMNKIYLKIEL